MGWTDLIFGLIGMILGAGGYAWIRRSQTQSSTLASSPPISPQEDSAALQQELQQTQQAYQRAQAMSQFKAGFLARASHELRAPLNGVIGTHQLILSDLCDDPAEEREFLQQAHTSVLKMLGLLDELIAIAKISHGSKPLQLKSVPLHQTFADVEQLTHILAANRNLRLKISPPEPDLQVTADPDWLRQAFLLLVDSAIASMEEGHIRLFVHPATDPNFIQIWLEDQRPPGAWQESLTLLQQETPPSAFGPEIPTQSPLVGDPATAHEPMKASTHFSLWLSQMLLERMGGSLEILATPISSVSGSASPAAASPTQPELENLTRIQCRIPRSAPVV